MNLENKVTCDMGIERTDQEKGTLNVKHDKQELTAAEGPSEVGNAKILVVSKSDCMEENFMGSDDAKDLEALSNANEYTITAKEEVLLPNKKVGKVKKVIKKRKLLKRKVTITKEEEKSKLSDMPDLSVEAKNNEDANIEDNLAGKTMTSSLLDKQDLAASIDMQKDVAGLASGVGDDDIFEVCKDDIIEAKFIGSENPQDLEDLTDTVALNDNVNTSKEVLLLPEKQVRRKNVATKRKLVKGKVTVAKDEVILQQSNLPDSSVEVSSQDAMNEKNHAGKTVNDSLLDKQVSADMENDETGLASEVGDDKMLLVPEGDDVREESALGSEDAKGMESLTDAITENEKEKNTDNTNSTKGMMLPEKVPKRKKIVKRRKLVKGKANMAKAGEKPQTSDMPNMKEEAKSTELTEKVSHEVTDGDNGGAKPSTKHDSLNKVETMGMIFMCSSKTKEDCYRYKIMGLPANKKDAVLKVYKGMRLFLFDFQLKLLYGIYKAAGPGGYNIEPEAFKSNFPSQVRFTVVRDCSPLPEEKFRNIIKDNYYTKNKFTSELNSEQVKSLCKLFQLGNKGLKSKAKVVIERAKARVRPIVDGQKKRKVRIENEERGKERRAEDLYGRDNKKRRVRENVKKPGNLKGARDEGRNQRVKRNAVRPRAADSIRRARLEDDARRRARFEDGARRVRAEEDARLMRFEEDARRLRLEDEERRLRMDDNARRLRADDRRHSPIGLNEDRYLRHADVLFEREMLDALPPPALQPYAAAPSYPGIGIGRTSLHSDYRLMGAAPENEDRGLAYPRPTRHLYDYETPYMPSYREPLVYRDPGYDVSSSRAYYPSLPVSRDEHLPSTSRAPRYHLSPYRRY